MATQIESARFTRSTVRTDESDELLALKDEVVKALRPARIKQPRVWVVRKMSRSLGNAHSGPGGFERITLDSGLAGRPKDRAIETIIHELAHGQRPWDGHKQPWQKEFARLIKAYERSAGRQIAIAHPKIRKRLGRSG